WARWTRRRRRLPKPGGWSQGLPSNGSSTTCRIVRRCWTACARRGCPKSERDPETGRDPGARRRRLLPACWRGRSRPTHKVTRTNDFRRLSALSRDFVTAKLDVVCRTASMTPPGRIIARRETDALSTRPYKSLQAGLEEASSQRRRKEHFVKRNERFRHAIIGAAKSAISP